MDLAGWVTETGSVADGQGSLGPGEPRFDLYPPLVSGCPATSTDDVQFPLRVTYRWGDLEPGVFDRAPLGGLDRWQAVLPPLAPGLSLGEGGTPLVADAAVADWAGFDGEVFIKDEGQNPTGSHKDRLNLCTTSAAVAIGAPGVVVASSGNHGIAAAAYTARAGLACVALLSDRAAATVAGRWMTGHGAAAVIVPRERRWPLVRALAERAGFHPASNMTEAHTGHPHGPEGYKTMAYELRRQLGRAPGSVFVPTGYGEMLYGLHRGFVELDRHGLIDQLPELYACEPSARAPLARAITSGRPVASVAATPTMATGTACTTSSYRGVVALTESRGAACPVDDADMVVGTELLAARGWWGEVSCGSSVAALRSRCQIGPVPGPTVCIVASRRAKNIGAVPQDPLPASDGTWESLTEVLAGRYGLRL